MDLPPNIQIVEPSAKEPMDGLTIHDGAYKVNTAMGRRFSPLHVIMGPEQFKGENP